jgi:hypothetical protein
MRMTDLELLNEAAEHYKIEKKFLFSLAKFESDMNPFAVRYEKGYRWLYNPERMAKRHKVTTETMTALQSMSWGLLQVMGANLYDVGGADYFDHMPQELGETGVNLAIGCQIINRIKKRYERPNYIYSVYNRGHLKIMPGGDFHNQENVDGFMFIYVDMPEYYEDILKYLTRL